MIVPGGKVTMFMAILMFGEPGAEILYPDPGFPIYRSMIEFTGATPVPVPIRETNGFIAADETLSLLTERTRLVILNSPANPTGGVTPKAEIDALVTGLDRHPQVAVLSDEIYGTMTYDGEAHLPPAVSGDPRPPDPSRRSLEDLRHDRLASRLVGLAEAALRRRPEARRQLLFLRQRGDAMGRDRGARRGPGLRRRHGLGLRPEAPARGGRPGTGCRGSPASRRRGASMPSRISARRAGRRKRSPPRSWRSRASRPSEGRISGSTARAISASHTPIPRRTSAGRWTAWAISWRGGRPPETNRRRDPRRDP